MDYNSSFMKKKENCFEKGLSDKRKERVDWIESKS